MEISAAAASTAQRLLEALESSRIPAGEGLVSTGPSPVPHQLVREFDELMAQPAPEAASGVQPVQGSAPQPEIPEALPGPEELYRAQVTLANFAFEARFGKSTADKVTKELETALRSQS